MPSLEVACIHWDAFARLLKSDEKTAIEAGGRKAGEEHGRLYAKLFE